jgi:hypothetical protein
LVPLLRIARCQTPPKGNPPTQQQLRIINTNRLTIDGAEFSIEVRALLPAVNPAIPRSTSAGLPKSHAPDMWRSRPSPEFMGEPDPIMEDMDEIPVLHPKRHFPGELILRLLCVSDLNDRNPRFFPKNAGLCRILNLKGMRWQPL